MANNEYVGDNKWIPSGDSEKEAQKLVWSTKIINDLMVALDKGYRPQVSMPFYEGKQFLRRGNIVFDYTDDELKEIAKCANDIVYFAETYAVVMTDNGIQQVKLREYQKDLLRDFQHNRFNIVLASRQMGKCHLYNTQIDIKDPRGNTSSISIGELYYTILKQQRPLKLTEWIKWKLWTLYSWLDNL
jgi:hypothetical protein